MSGGDVYVYVFNRGGLGTGPVERALRHAVIKRYEQMGVKGL